MALPISFQNPIFLASAFKSSVWSKSTAPPPLPLFFFFFFFFLLSLYGASDRFRTMASPISFFQTSYLSCCGLQIKRVE
jgi:hypothetical protein